MKTIDDSHRSVLRDDATRAAFHAATPTADRLTWTTAGETVVAHPSQEFDTPTRVVRVEHVNCWATSCFPYRPGPMNYRQSCTRREIREPIDSRPQVLVIRENGDTTVLPAEVLSRA
ncbi:hypothetical protein [Kineococcus sp. R86509]|uniref:hypothetical protein n=1 Tax=Kineococcus sp. R86509 TaxID=3093851 RepID=UPI0036D33B83